MTTVSKTSTPKVMAMKNRNSSKDFRPGTRLRKKKKMKRRDRERIGTLIKGISSYEPFKSQRRVF